MIQHYRIFENHELDNLGRETFTIPYFCPDLCELGEWLRAARPLLIDGNLFYSPHFDYYKGPDSYRRARAEFLREVLICNKRVLDHLRSKKFIEAGLIKPILELELPILDKIDLPTFAKITVDEQESLITFRNFFTSEAFGYRRLARK